MEPYLFNRCAVDQVHNRLRIELLGILQVIQEVVVLDQSHFEHLAQVLRYLLLHALFFLSLVDHRLINN